MENSETRTAYRQTNLDQFAGFDSDSQTIEQRLNLLLSINAETARQREMFATDRELLEAQLMRHPLTLEQTFSYFGLILGSFAPAAMFIKVALDARLEGWVFGVMLIINLISAVIGFFSGKTVAKAVRVLEKQSWNSMILILPLVGLLWGIVSGAAGGIIVFIIGAFFGAILGGMVGSIALPVFTVLHRLLKRGEVIDQRHFLPLAFGVTFIICGFIFGL